VVSLAKALVTVLEVVFHALVTLLVRSVVGVGHSEFLENSKLGLNEVEPGRLRGRADRVNVWPLQLPKEPWMVVD